MTSELITDFTEFDELFPDMDPETFFDHTFTHLLGEETFETDEEWREFLQSNIDQRHLIVIANGPVGTIVGTIKQKRLVIKTNELYEALDSVHIQMPIEQIKSILGDDIRIIDVRQVMIDQLNRLLESLTSGGLTADDYQWRFVMIRRICNKLGLKLTVTKA